MDDLSHQINDTADRMADVLEDSLAAREPGDNRAIFGIIGEQHAVSAHLLAGLRAARTLKNRGYKIACAIEAPYNEVSALFARKAWPMSSARINAVCNRLRRLPYDHPIHLQYLAGNKDFYYANLTKRVRHRFLLEEGISTRFNDAARRNDYNLFFLDKNDPIFLRAISQADKIQKEYYKKSSDIHSKGRAGIHIRNLIMRDLAIEHADAIGADIYLLFGGAAHSTGVGNFPFKESLAGILSAENRHVIAIPLARIYPPSEARNSPAVLLNCSIRAPGFEGVWSRARERRFLNEKIPYVLPGTNVHIDLIKFQADCKKESRAFLKSLAV
jgi:hypothetical protein